MTDPRVDVLIAGGGPAGLAAAVELRREGIERVMVVERDLELGGMPRHCDHPGFGLFDLNWMFSGPAYARHRARLAGSHGAECLTGTTVLGARPGPGNGEWRVDLLGPGGAETVSCRAMLLATGSRERPRTARLVPGDRPMGVLTTGSLQQLGVLHGVRPGRRAVIVGAEHVSFSAIQTLVDLGMEPVAMVTDLPRHQTYPPFKWLTADRHGVPILTDHRVTGIRGRKRVEAVSVMDITSNAARDIPCDTVVFTGDFVPEHELARRIGLVLDRATRGPAVDQRLRTSSPGIFAAGNLLRGAESADVAALEGTAAARSLIEFLLEDRWRPSPGIPVLVEPPLTYVFPGMLGEPFHERPLPWGQFTLRTACFVEDAVACIHQGERLLSREPLGDLVPNRPVRLESQWLVRVRRDAGPVIVRL